MKILVTEPLVGDYRNGEFKPPPSDVDALNCQSLRRVVLLDVSISHFATMSC